MDGITSVYGARRVLPSHDTHGKLLQPHMSTHQRSWARVEGILACVMHDAHVRGHEMVYVGMRVSVKDIVIITINNLLLLLHVQLSSGFYRSSSVDQQQSYFCWRCQYVFFDGVGIVCICEACRGMCAV